MIPFLVLLKRYGAKLRQRSVYAFHDEMPSKPALKEEQTKV